ncbi:MAG: hypothetical protein PHR30_18780 [Gallionellaceae bacterium]|nr:hypothetical protein [Gallionellaceae bacterium]
MEVPVKTIEIDLTAVVFDREISVRGDLLGCWLAPDTNAQIGIRFQTRSEPLIPFRQGMFLELAFDRIFITNPAMGLGTMYLIYGDATAARIHANPSDVGVLTAIRDELTGDEVAEGAAAAVVGVAAALAVAANQDRKGLHLQAGTGNAGTINIGPAATVTVANGIQLVAGQAFWISDYRGPIWAIATGAGQRLNWFEV